MNYLNNQLCWRYLRWLYKIRRKKKGRYQNI